MNSVRAHDWATERAIIASNIGPKDGLENILYKERKQLNKHRTKYFLEHLLEHFGGHHPLFCETIDAIVLQHVPQ